MDAVSIKTGGVVLKIPYKPYMPLSTTTMSVKVL